MIEKKSALIMLVVKKIMMSEQGGSVLALRLPLSASAPRTDTATTAMISMTKR